MHKVYPKFIILCVLVLGIGIFMSRHFVINWAICQMSDREFNLVTETKAEISNQILWFQFDGDNIKLCSNPLLQDAIHSIAYFDVTGTVNEADISNFVFQDDMSGTYLAQSDSVFCDIDGDNVKESVIVCAKCDTNETQGYSGYATCFASEKIPIELDASDKTQLMVYVYGKPYTGTLLIHSARGTEKTVDIKDGFLSFVDARDLRSGIVVTCEMENDNVLIGTYVQEKHTLFSIRYFTNLIPFAIILLIDTLLITCVVQIRKKYRKNKTSRLCH